MQLRRIVSSGTFIPEIDGLRFVAIGLVLAYHVFGQIQLKDVSAYTAGGLPPWVETAFAQGHIGVPLFFVISGFILARPFARQYLQGGREVLLKSYFARRLTRLEPPYVLVMTGLLVVYVFVLGALPLAEASRSYVASVLYGHNVAYGREVLPRLNAVAWSLEVEVQFYVLMPLLALVYRLGSFRLRAGVLAVATAGVAVASVAYPLPFRSLYDYLPYFLGGLLLADVYVRAPTKRGLPGWAWPPAYGLPLAIVAVEAHRLGAGGAPSVGLYLLQVGLVTGFCAVVLWTPAFASLSRRWVTNIGGMCYSIYLIHFPLIAIASVGLFGVQVSNHLALNYLFYAAALLAVVLAVSTAFFVLVERPCMDHRWPSRLAARIGFRP